MPYNYNHIVWEEQAGVCHSEGIFLRIKNDRKYGSLLKSKKIPPE